MNEGHAKAASPFGFGREQGCRNVTLSPLSWQDGAAQLAMKLSSGQAICRFPFAGVLLRMLLHVLSTEHGNGSAGKATVPSCLVGGCGEAGARLLLEVCGVRMRDSRQMTTRECGQTLEQSPRGVLRYISLQIVQSSAGQSPELAVLGAGL